MKLPLVYHGYRVEYEFIEGMYEGEIIDMNIKIKAYNLEQLEENFKNEIDKLENGY
jgi:hypothetical protein